ncbi:unnamed protein product, partial [Ectocarpus sp. 12 AP-2014]
RAWRTARYRCLGTFCSPPTGAAAMTAAAAAAKLLLLPALPVVVLPTGWRCRGISCGMAAAAVTAAAAATALPSPRAGFLRRVQGCLLCLLLVGVVKKSMLRRWCWILGRGWRCSPIMCSRASWKSSTACSPTRSSRRWLRTRGWGPRRAEGGGPDRRSSRRRRCFCRRRSCWTASCRFATARRSSSTPTSAAPSGTSVRSTTASRTTPSYTPQTPSSPTATGTMLAAAAAATAVAGE